MSISLKNDAGTFSTNLNQSNPTANVGIALPTTGGTMARTEDVIGVGQTWQDITASRALGTTYTNSTGKPIVVNPIIIGSGSNTIYSTITVDGVIVGYSISFGGGNYSSCPIIIPVSPFSIRLILPPPS